MKYLPSPGVSLDGVLAMLKDVEHFRQLQQRLAETKNIVIIVGGFIGIEFVYEIYAIGTCVQKGMMGEDSAMFLTGTHPALTASPIAYPLVNAAEVAISCMQ